MMFTSYRRIINGAQSGNLQQRYLFLGDLRQPFFFNSKNSLDKVDFLSLFLNSHHANIVSVYARNKESSFFFHFLVR